MQRVMLKSKLHRATVTDVNVAYEGSITVDEGLMEMANLLPFEQVSVYNISNGKRFQTYVIKGKRDSGEICINGAAAWLARRGDLIIIASYATITEEEARAFGPVLVYLDKDNRITKRITDA